MHFQNVMEGMAPNDEGKMKRTYVTAGDYILVVTGKGTNVKEAQREAYRACWAVEGDTPCDIGFRTDIGDRLKKELPKLQDNGYALGMAYNG